MTKLNSKIYVILSAAKNLSVILGRFFGRPSLRMTSILILIISFLLTACPGKRPSRKPRLPEHRRPPIAYPDEIKTPERKAAFELITKGQRALDREDPEKGEHYFQEAVRLDPSYGPAYYWLARAKYELDERRKAWDLLDRAELLIGQDPVWLERIDQFRGALSH